MRPMNDAGDDDYEDNGEEGEDVEPLEPWPTASTVCFTCRGMRKISHPRLYVLRADEDVITGTTVGELRTCPQCAGEGRAVGFQPPV